MAKPENDLWSDVNNPNNSASMDDWADSHNPNNGSFGGYGDPFDTNEFLGVDDYD